MAIENGSVDECGTGGHTPPPLYQSLPTQNVINYSECCLDPRENRPNYAPNSYELYQITKNTKSSAASVSKIRQMLEEDKVTNLLKNIYEELETQDATINSIIPIIGLIFIFQMLFFFVNVFSKPYLTINRMEEFRAVDNLNLTEDDMQIVFNFAKRHVLVDLRNCISQYLTSLQ